MARPKTRTLHENSARLVAAVRALITDGTVLDPEVRARLEKACDLVAETGDDVTPAGVVGIVFNPQGAAVAQHADFKLNGYGGFSLKEAQTMRARNGAMLAFAKAHLNDWMVRKADMSFAERYWELAEASGYRMELMVVGHPDDGR